MISNIRLLLGKKTSTQSFCTVTRTIARGQSVGKLLINTPLLSLSDSMFINGFPTRSLSDCPQRVVSSFLNNLQALQR